MRLLLVLFALAVILPLGGCKQSVNSENELCDGVFFMDMDGFSNKSICSDHLDTYVLNKNDLSLMVMNDELAGKVIFELMLNPYEGPGEYKFGTNANKTGNTSGGTNSNPGIIGNNHLDKDIARESLFHGFDLGTSANDHFALNWDNSLKDIILQTHGFDTDFEGFDDFVFVTRIGVDDIPSGVNRWGDRG